MRGYVVYFEDLTTGENSIVGSHYAGTIVKIVFDSKEDAENELKNWADPIDEKYGFKYVIKEVEVSVL